MDAYYRTIVELAAATTTTETGLRVLAEWDQGFYPTGIEITADQLAAIPLTGHQWHPDWNYDIAATAARRKRTTRV